jgi:hypothetical protein
LARSITFEVSHLRLPEQKIGSSQLEERRPPFLRSIRIKGDDRASDREDSQVVDDELGGLSALDRDQRPGGALGEQHRRALVDQPA